VIRSRAVKTAATLPVTPRRALLAVLLALALSGCGKEETSAEWMPVSPRTRGETTSQALPDGLFSWDRRSSACSAVCVGLFADLPFGGMFLVAVALAWIHRRRARAEEALDPAAPLADGSAVLFGVVEGEAGEVGEDDPPVVVTIHQHGTETYTKNGTFHAWKETARQITARPFYLRRADGARVRVEPGEGVVVHDGLLRTARHRARDERSRVAEVRAGEQVHISGELMGAGAPARRGSAYRGAATDPVLVPPRLAPMVISNEPPGDTEKRRQRFHAFSAVALAAALAFAWGVVLPDYARLLLDGQVVRVAPTAVRTWQVWVKPKNGAGHYETRYALRAEALAPDGPVTLEAHCGEALYRCAGWGRCAEVPFVVAAHHPSVSQIGERATISNMQTMVLVLMALFLGAIYPLAALGTRPWYARRKVNDSGRGGLTDPE
jgi:hypothetical protein